ncbi:hypothetical protein [Dokdonia sp. Asnod1-B02]|uniref:hypothetical protein n=1 Tax=Dokdonia sp. Asnod1-B02 TaxID=3160573 RepID=UPI0038709786
MLKFSSFSFSISQPEDWNTFVSYLGGILNPILTLINLIIFIKLTKSIQRASENKSWVERTENLTFELIDSISKEAAFLTFFTQSLNKIDIEKQNDFITQNQVMEKISVLNNNVSEQQLKLRLYIESSIFENCETRKPFLKSIENLIPKINDFLDVYALPKYDKSKELMSSFVDIENSIKDTIEKGKQFCDEIYYL